MACALWWECFKQMVCYLKDFVAVERTWTDANTPSFFFWHVLLPFSYLWLRRVCYMALCDASFCLMTVISKALLRQRHHTWGEEAAVLI